MDVASAKILFLRYTKTHKKHDFYVYRGSMHTRRIYLLFVALFSYATSTHALQQRSHSLHGNMKLCEDKTAIKHQVVRGGMHIVPNELTYRGYQDYTGLNKIVDAAGNPLTFAPQDVLIECRAMSVVSHSWAACGHVTLGCSFPVYLPLSLLDGKKEGDIVSFFFKTDHGNVVKIELKCEQFDFSVYKEYGPFEKALQSLQAAFMRNPVYALADVERLVKEGILAKRITTFGTESYSHGERGFYFDCAAYDTEMKIAAGYDADDEMEFVESENDGGCIIS